MRRVVYLILHLALIALGCEPDRSALVGDAEVLKIGYELQSICDLPFPVQFNPTVNFDEEDNYQWDFGDGSQSNKKAPLHEYDKEGLYEVKLTVGNSSRTVLLDLARKELQPAILIRTPVVSPFQELFIENKSTGYDSAYWEYSVGGANVGIFHTPSFRFLVVSLVPIEVTLVLLCRSGSEARLTQLIEVTPYQTNNIYIHYARYLPRYQNGVYLEFAVNGEIVGTSHQKTNTALPLEWNLPQEMSQGVNVLEVSENTDTLEIRLFIEEKLANTYALDTKFIREYRPVRLGFPYDPYFDTFNVGLGYEPN